MPNKNISTTHESDLVREVIGFSQVKLTQKGKLGGLALKNGRSLDRFPKAKQPKRERKEFSIKAIREPIQNAIALGTFSMETPTAIDVTTKNYLVGDVCEFQNSAKKSKGSLTVIVTEITNDSLLKVLKIGGSDIAIDAGDLLFFKSNANPEASQGSKLRPINRPVSVYNYTQILKASRSISGTEAVSENHDDVRRQLKLQCINDMSEQLDGLTTSQVRNKVDMPDGTVIRIAGGVKFFATNKFDKEGNIIPGQKPANTKTINGQFTLNDINDGFQHAIENGGTLNSIMAGATQLRRLAEIEKDKVNINVIDGSNPGALGGAVNVIKSPINIDGNVITNLFYDPKMSDDELIMFNVNNVGLTPLKGREMIEDFKPAKGSNDTFTYDLLCEYTFDYIDAEANTFVLEKLS